MQKNDSFIANERYLNILQFYGNIRISETSHMFHCLLYKCIEYLTSFKPLAKNKICNFYFCIESSPSIEIYLYSET